MPDLASPLPLALALMRERSVTPQAAGCFDLLQGWLEELGFTVRRRIFEGDGGEPTENVYARRGDTPPNLCFAGHVDVVPPGREADWDIPPFEPEIREGVLYGRGAEDMKAAIAAMVSGVARTLRQGEPAGSISFLLTADEEGNGINGTKKALRWITEELGQRLDYCLVGEPTNPQHIGEMAKIGRRGSLVCTLEVTGTQGHIAYPDRADNPCTRLIDILHRLKHTPIDEGSDFFPPSNLEVTTIDVGNSTHNLIPARARAEFGIRFNDRHDGESIRHWVHRQCEAAGGAYTLEMRVSGESFIFPPGPLSEALCAAVREVTGHAPQLTTTGGTSDARFIKDYCPVIEFGTTGRTPHQINEHVKTRDLEALTEIYHRFIGRILTERKL